MSWIFFVLCGATRLKRSRKRHRRREKKYEYLYESNFLFSISMDINKNIILIAQLLVYPQ